jgi:ribosomal protein S18 acetylase RimI-like enzyme
VASAAAVRVPAPLRDMIAIVPYESGLLVPLVDMWRASFEHGVGIVDPHPIEEQREHFVKRVLSNFEVSVAMREDEIVGFAASDRESISQLYVRVGCHRQGIGTTLLDLAKSRSAGSLWLYTFARNTIARRFYERSGFVAIAHGFENMWHLEDVKYRWESGSDT